MQAKYKMVSFLVIILTLVVLGAVGFGQGLIAPVPLAPDHQAVVPGDSVTLKWEAVEGALRYRVLVMDLTDDPRNNLEVFAVPGRDTTELEFTGFNGEGLASDGRAYRWRVIAGNASGFNLSQGWSAARIFMSGTLPAPQTVSPSQGEVVTGENIKFEWEAVPGAMRYILIVRNVDSGEDHFRENVGRGKSFELGGFINDGASYVWRVRAVNRGALGSLSSPSMFTHSAEEPELKVVSVEAISN